MRKGQKKRVWTLEQKLEIVHKHLDEHISVKRLGKEYNADHGMICRWTKEYLAEGEAGLAPKPKPGNKFAALHRSKNLSELEYLRLMVAKQEIEIAKVDCPTVHWMKLGRNAPAKTPDNPYNWAPRTITGILEKQEYLGHMVNFKTRKLSYKSKKKLENPPEQWKIFENTHEAIIDEETFARVQELRKNKRRPTRTGKTNMFSGLVRCADCGEKLYYCTSNSFETRQDHFVCSTSRKKGKEVCDTHFIRAVVLEEGTLQHMRLVISCVASYEDAFRKALGAKRSEEAKKELSAKKRTLQKSENRLAELDRLFKRIYEDI